MKKPDRQWITVGALLLVYVGAMCPKCFHGTRRTSKRWAKCTHCGERVERRPYPEVPPTSQEIDR